jgi:hypothetical protein
VLISLSALWAQIVPESCPGRSIPCGTVGRSESSG